MSLGLRWHGQAIGIDPHDPLHAVYTNRDVVGAWEAVRITAHADGWVDVLFLEANRQLCITPAGQFESRDAGAIGAWEQLTLTTEPATIGRVGVTLTIDGDPPVAPLVPLRISGRDFVDETGARRVLNGCDMFMAYRQFLDGGAAALVPFVEESHTLGFDLWRVFLMGSKAQNQVMDLQPSEPDYYDRLRPFVATLNANGITLLATVFVDAQDVMPDLARRQQHWRDVADRLRGSVTILSGGNEWRKNGFNPGELADPGMIWSRGSDLSVGDNEHAPYRPYGRVAEYHPRRDLWASLMDTVASPVFIHETNGLTGPLIIDEPPKMGTHGSRGFEDPPMARRFAQHYAAECGGAVFHNAFGQRGLRMDDPTRACAAAWQQGMRR